MQSHETLLIAAARGLMKAALDTPGAVDQDVADALEALIRTQRTLQSGVLYETRPASSPANSIYGLLQAGLDKFRKGEAERLGAARTRDAEVLGILAFLQRVELHRQNGRPRGRAFLDFLRNFVGSLESAPQPASSLILS